MKLIQAEAIKIFKSWFFWIMIAVHVVIFILLFFQFTLNESSNVIEPLLKQSENLYSFFILFFSAIFNTVFAVLLGSRVVSLEYSGNTTGSMVQAAGRYKPFIAKGCILLISASLMTTILFLIGIILPIIFWNDVGSMALGGICLRMLFGIVSTFMISLFSMTMSVLLRNVSRGNTVSLLVLLSTQFLPYNVSKYFLYLNPYYYLSSFSDRVFNNLKGLSNISFGTQNTMSDLLNIGLLILYGGVCVLSQVLVYKKREYSS